jgi:uncharacterized protein (DUF1015 family)
VPRSGVTYSGELEWREAARFALCRWTDFCRLDGEEQSGIVAHFRVHNQLEAVIAHEQARERRLKGRRGK